jgi:spermidine synthase
MGRLSADDLAAVQPVAEKYFDFHSEGLNIFAGDGRFFVNQSRRQYDVIILDAFLGDSSPSHLFTRESFTAMRRILRTSCRRRSLLTAQATL